MHKTRRLFLSWSCASFQVRDNPSPHSVTTVKYQWEMRTSSEIWTELTWRQTASTTEMWATLSSHTLSHPFSLYQPAPMVKPEIISGKDRRTESNVLFGKPELGSEYYETTTASTFQPVSAPYTYKRSDSNTRSAVPLKYYGGCGLELIIRFSFKLLQVIKLMVLHTWVTSQILSQEPCTSTSVQLIG